MGAELPSLQLALNKQDCPFLTIASAGTRIASENFHMAPARMQARVTYAYLLRLNEHIVEKTCLWTCLDVKPNVLTFTNIKD